MTLNALFTIRSTILRRIISSSNLLWVFKHVSLFWKLRDILTLGARLRSWQG